MNMYQMYALDISFVIEHIFYESAPLAKAFCITIYLRNMYAVRRDASGEGG